MRQLPVSVKIFLIAFLTFAVIWSSNKVLADGSTVDTVPNPWAIVAKIASENLAAVLVGVCISAYYVYTKAGISDRVRDVEAGTIANNKLLLAIAKKLDINSLN